MYALRAVLTKGDLKLKDRNAEVFSGGGTTWSKTDQLQVP